MSDAKAVLWFIYRDEKPVVGTTRVVQFAHECLLAYQRRTGKSPTLLGVTSSFPREDETRLTKEGLKVIHNLPAWAGHEVWVGRERD